MPTLTLTEFGEMLLRLGDLDPVYPVLLSSIRPNRDKLRRTILAYALFYDLGAAFYLASRKDFWSGVLIAARNEAANPTPFGTRWPRGAERRHFRGKKCVLAVDELAAAFPLPEQLIAKLIEPGGELKEVMDRLQNLPQFGPWIAFKLADIGERVLEAPIRFPPHLDGSLYASPLFTVRLLASREGIAPEEIWDRALAHFAKFAAPPRNERACGAQEVETVFCKYGSYLKGHYYPGKDLKEIRHSLKRWEHRIFRRTNKR
jgi:Alpha-glutamyl/putrescinyl thymine pyrophosphorylase clade 2